MPTKGQGQILHTCITNLFQNKSNWLDSQSRLALKNGDGVGGGSNARKSSRSNSSNNVH